MSAKETPEHNVVLIYTGSPIEKSSHLYLVAESTTDEVKKGTTVGFVGRLVGIESIGSVVTTFTDNGKSFKGSRYAASDIRDKFHPMYADRILTWSADTRVRVERDAQAAAAKKEHPKHISQIVKQLAQATAHMTVRERAVIASFITSKILR